jgi:tetratricopeptide (TPR) repeat protein
VTQARYTAFLSYSHRDAAPAGALHRRLEAYRIPGRLVGSEGEHGPVPARLSPIFRDREELPAAGDLSEKVRAALAASDHLIVICSPDSAASPWVGKEIALFREIHPGRPILAAIVAGEPGQCFPAGLAQGGAEPLAADLRPDRDGRRLGFLKLVAGLAGVGLDDLVQRDAARRVRRVTWVTAGALAAMLVMAIMTTLALNARAEAQRQRAEAEGLVEFMRTDLRDKLQGVGRLDALGSANSKALSYYGKQSLEDLGEESLARRARIQQAIGDDALAADDFDAALAAFEDARKTTAEQVARFPDKPERWAEHVKSLYGLGRVHEFKDDWVAADAHYRAAAQIADRLAAAASQDPDLLARAASAAVNLGNVRFSGTHDYVAAELHYAKAVDLFDRAARLRPGDSHILLNHANALGWLADSYYMRDLWPRSLEMRRRQLAIVEALSKASPKNADYMFRLAAAERGIAHSLIKSGERGEAAGHLLRARRLAVRLSELDGDNAEWAGLKAKLDRDLLKPEFRNASRPGFLPGTPR